MLEGATKSLKSIARPLIDRWHLWPLIYKWRYKWRRPDLYIDADQFVGFRPPLQKLMLRAANTRFYQPSEHCEITGWHSPKERQILYALARWLPGPIIEIGSWCGLSTTAIARGIRDSGKKKSFHTYDLELTVDNFRPVDGGIGLFLDGDNVAHGVCSEEVYRRNILPILNEPGSAEGALRRNLERLGLANFVTIHRGDFRNFPAIQGGFVFCDAMHDLHEISSNGPALRRFLRPGSILACDDIVLDPGLLAAVREILPLGYGVNVHSLHIAEVI
jgi:predicted O-methyltransferase YrrM